MSITVQVAGPQHFIYANDICQVMADAALVRGTGIAKRKPDYVRDKMREGKAIIATSNDNRLAGFCYIEHWEGRKFVANSGLIVHPDFRGLGLAKQIKSATFQLSRKRYPNAKLFGITTSPAVMHINTDLGYRPVPLYELTTDQAFWKGCASCPNYDILQRTDQRMCLCTGMICDFSKLPPTDSSTHQSSTDHE
ncbi:MAG: GNAT family N-acetyltransferase [Saprospiraceae bacterium]